MPALRPNSFLDRLQHAGRVLLGREERNLPLADFAYTSGIGKGAPFKPEESMRAYGDNPYLYSAINVISTEAARVQMLLHKVNKKGDTQPVEKHQALETLKYPQPIKGGKSILTGMDLMIITYQHLLLTGEAFWVMDKLRNPLFGGAPSSLSIALPQFMYTRTDDNGNLTEYVYRMPQREERLDPMSVVHFKLNDPLEIIRGHSPMQSIRYSVDSHKEADKMAYKRLTNNAVPSGIITTEQNLTDDQQKKFRDQWRGLYGGTDNAGKVALMPKGLDFKTVQQTNQEMQYVEGKNANRDEILANFRVGLEMLGRTESQTRANADAAIYVFERFVILPLVEKVRDTLNNDYLIVFPGTDGMEFTFDDPVPENVEEKLKMAQTLASIGSMTPNEVREEFGKEPATQPGMDEFYMDFGKVAVGETPPEPDPLVVDQNQPT